MSARSKPTHFPTGQNWLAWGGDRSVSSMHAMRMMALLWCGGRSVVIHMYMSLLLAHVHNNRL